MSQFIAKDDQGNVHTILIIPVFANTTTSAGSGRKHTMNEYKTSDGRHVNRIEKGRYEIVETETILTSDDPSAP